MPSAHQNHAEQEQGARRLQDTEPLLLIVWLESYMAALCEFVCAWLTCDREGLKKVEKCYTTICYYATRALDRVCSNSFHRWCMISNRSLQQHRCFKAKGWNVSKIYIHLYSSAGVFKRFIKRAKFSEVKMCDSQPITLHSLTPNKNMNCKLTV